MAEPEKEIKETVPTEPEDTKVTPETPPAVPDPDPEPPKDDLRDLVAGLQSQVETLTETVQGIVNNASPEPDSSPVRKPWTHWGNR